MLVLADTNVLLRVAKRDDPNSRVAGDALRSLVNAGHVVTIVPQCCYEFYVVATRPTGNNGLGLEPAEAVEHLERFLGLYRLLRDERQVFDLWRRLVEEKTVRGKPAHDARLVAAMQRHGVTQLLTFNGADFERYRDAITLLDPIAISSSS